MVYPSTDGQPSKWAYTNTTVHGWESNSRPVDSLITSPTTWPLFD